MAECGVDGLLIDGAENWLESEGSSYGLRVIAAS